MVRFAVENDLEDIFQIRLQLHQLHTDNRPDIYKMPENPEEFHQLLVEDAARDAYRLIVCENDFCTVGYALTHYVNRSGLCMMQDRHTFFIDEIAIAKDFQRQGYGKELLSAILNSAKMQHADSVELSVWNFNEPAMRFYEACGMTPKHTTLEFPFPK